MSDIFVGYEIMDINNARICSKGETIPHEV